MAQCEGKTKARLSGVVCDAARYNRGVLGTQLKHEPSYNVTFFRRIVWTGLLVATAANACAAEPLVPQGWNPKQAGDAVMQRLIRVTAPEIKGAHDSALVVVGDRAYVVAEVSEKRSGESPSWPEIYSTLSVVDRKQMKLLQTIPFARGEQKFANETLPYGSCFVPRVWPKDARTLRCYFHSQEPGKRLAQTWTIDFDTETMTFADRIERARLQTPAGTFDLNPKSFHDAAAAFGFRKPPADYGLYIIDAFKVIDGTTYAGMNNFATGQNALVVVKPDLTTFEVVGHINEPQSLKLTEVAIQKLPDGSWLAILRQEAGNRNYVFATSADGKTWNAAEHRDVVLKGTASKPTLDKFGDVYYLGWQESTKINDANRSVFNLEVSRDGKTWERKYRFETERSFQYPTFYEHDGAIWLSVTQGDDSPTRKERIMFGKLENVGEFDSQLAK
jgi:hypothetical protein